MRSPRQTAVGHVGPIPSKATWIGGFRAVGKTAGSAATVRDQIRRPEEAGVLTADLEEMPDLPATEITRRMPLIMLGMGAGPHADAQYLFAEDLLGHTRDHRPRHARRYREFRADVASGACPAPDHVVTIADDAFAEFLNRLPE